MLTQAQGTKRKARKPPGSPSQMQALAKGTGKRRWLESRRTSCTCAWGSHLGHALLYSCQASRPLAGDTAAPLRDRLAALGRAGAFPSLQPRRQPGDRIR